MSDRDRISDLFELLFVEVNAASEQLDRTRLVWLESSLKQALVSVRLGINRTK